jgi:rhodanese-related sulfurtransferase
MRSLDLPDPKMMDVAVPANMSVGLSQDEIARSGWSLDPVGLASALRGGGVVLVDLREQTERDRYGEIPGSLHIAYGALANNLKAGSSLRSATRGKDLVFYCAYGERSAMAVRSAHDVGISTARHLHGGFDRWTKDRASVSR